MKEGQLHIEQIYDYCDGPQVFSARDAYDTLYLCLLYSDEPLKYTAIRISSQRLKKLLDGEDLRAVFLNPEKDSEYFEVQVDHEGDFIKSDSPISEIDESRLPEEGYTISGGDRESILVSVPMKDKPLFRDIIKRFGWIAM